MKNKKPWTERVLRPKLRPFVIQTDWFRGFSVWDRIKILFGCKMIVKVRIFTQHNPGQFQPIIAGEVTKYQSEEEYYRHEGDRDNVIEAAQKEIAKQ